MEDPLSYKNAAVTVVYTLSQQHAGKELCLHRSHIFLIWLVVLLRQHIGLYGTYAMINEQACTDSRRPADCGLSRH